MIDSWLLSHAALSASDSPLMGRQFVRSLRSPNAVHVHLCMAGFNSRLSVLFDQYILAHNRMCTDRSTYNFHVLRVNSSIGCFLCARAAQWAGGCAVMTTVMHHDGMPSSLLMTVNDDYHDLLELSLQHIRTNIGMASTNDQTWS